MRGIYPKAAFMPARRLDRGCGFLKRAESLPDHPPHDERDGHHQHDHGQRDMLQHLARSEEHTSELQSLMRISYAVFCLKKKKKRTPTTTEHETITTQHKYH